MRRHCSCFSNLIFRLICSNFAVMTTEQIIIEIKRRLQECNDVAEANALARMVVEEVLHYSPVDVLLRGNVEQDEVLVERIRSIADRLCKGEPIQYIFGYARFHGHEFKVTPATLIPRPETELLVDMIADDAADAADLRVLDIGTGSGCIAISLALALRWPEVEAFDISAEALAVAKQNAASLKAKVDFVQADILTAVPEADSLDIVVSNPPYICESERADMERNVLEHEPATALFVPDTDPLLFYRAIAKYAAVALKPAGRIYLEINRRFGNETCRLLETNGFDQAQVIRDQFGNPRIVKAQLPARH